jgi:hypothetical protein
MLVKYISPDASPAANVKTPSINTLLNQQTQHLTHIQQVSTRVRTFTQK